MPSEADARQEKQARAAQAKQVVDIFLEISTLLVCAQSSPQIKATAKCLIQNSDLDRETLSVCISLIENGVNPEALAVSDWCHVAMLDC